MKEIMSDLVFKIIELLHIILLNFMCINTTMYIINRNAELSSIKYVTFGNINNIECIPFGITLYLNRLSLLCVFPDNSRTYCKQPPKVRKLRGRLREVLGTLRYPGRGGKENGESLERGRRHLRGKNKLRFSRLSGVLA